MQRRVVLGLFGILMAAFAVLAGRCVVLQGLRHAYYAQKSLKQQQSRLPQKGCRGPVLDSRGHVLAASSATRTVFLEPRIIADRKDTADRLSQALHMSGPEISRLILEAKNPGFVRIKSGATLTESLAAQRIRGVGVQNDWVRAYPMGALTAHVVGFVSTDGVGLAGVELAHDKQLSGPSREDLFLVDLNRRPLRWIGSQGPAESQDEELSGGGVILTVDASIQQFAREELWAQFKAFQAESAIAVVANPRNGAILAMVSLPDFDPDDRSVSDNARCNHAIIDQFEPGSVIKPVIAAIALDAGVINTHERIDCEDGSYRGKGFGTITEYSNHHYGQETVKGILVKSSNIGMAKIGQRLGGAKLHRGLGLFGFGKDTRVGLPGEARGLLRPPEAWTGYSVTRIPFGQEIGVTAMQLVKSFCILANHGRLVRPHVVRATVDAAGQPDIREFSLTMAGQVGYVVRPEVADWVIQEAMVGVVQDEDGTGKPARLEKWKVFGKTGTAQLAKPDGRGYEEGAYIGSFVGGAPAEDPAVVVLVSVRRPNVKLGKGYTGGAVAAPVVGRIIDKTMTYLEAQGQAFPRNDPARLAQAR